MAKEIQGPVTMAKAIQGPVAEPRAVPFRFLDLPAEVRNEIYKKLLCTVHDSETGYMVPLRHQIHPQILGTCRRVYHEGSYIMRRNNLFVEITTYNDSFFERLEWPLQCFNIPSLVLDKHQRRNFKGIVLSHELSQSSVILGIADSFIILHRHLDRFCAALRYLEVTSEFGDDQWWHTITLHNPYEPSRVNNNAELPPFLYLKRQEELLEPYRRLGALDRFVV